MNRHHAKLLALGIATSGWFSSVAFGQAQRAQTATAPSSAPSNEGRQRQHRPVNNDSAQDAAAGMRRTGSSLLKATMHARSDPAQARVEAESVKAIQTRYQDAEKFKMASETAEDYRTRAIAIKEARADLVKDHLWVLWTDYFKPEHLEKYPQLHELFWNAPKEAGLAKKSVDPEQGQKLLDAIDEIGKIFWEITS